MAVHKIRRQTVRYNYHIHTHTVLLTFQRAVHAHGALIVAEHAGITTFVSAGVDQFPSLALIEGDAARGAHRAAGIVFQEPSNRLKI